MAHLAYLIGAINGKLDQLKGLDPGDPRIQSMLRREQDLEKSRSEYSSELKSHQESLKKLEEDPDSVEGTAVYRDIKSAYEAS
ncbi:hypothetical protein [Cohnella sp. JJ-181]|uniref:hypothetical protein n=1 Tax=Cohnella rhizoplanae TaxID=2974897 RepID=UPI00232F400A|nr:hypothetical protein [Cohnella sp. JJ-181]